jgi:hypothetical protein
MEDYSENQIPVAPAFKRNAHQAQALCPFCSSSHWILPGEIQTVFCQGVHPVRYRICEPPLEIPKWLVA